MVFKFAHTSSFFAFSLTFLLLGIAFPYDPTKDHLVEDVFTSLDKALDFFYRARKTINLDGVFGLRVAQGALLSVINDAQDGKLHISKENRENVKRLYHKASLIAEDALPFLQQSSPDYFKKFRKQVSAPWPYFKPFKKLQKRENTQRSKSKKSNVNFDEDTSDHCLSELTGTAADSNCQPCKISDRCWNLIVAEGTEGYVLTHQALFFLVGEIQGCRPILLKRLEHSNINGGLQEFYGRICSDMYPQMMEIERKRTLEESNYQRDLYMEQAMVCGSMGFHDFLSSERLRNILSWQRSEGCFGETVKIYDKGSQNTRDHVRADDHEVFDNTEKDAEESERPFEAFKASLGYKSFLSRKTLSMRTMRALLVEKELQDGCLSHVSGVATGLLGVYVRWLLYPHELVQDSQTSESFHHMQNGENEIFTNDNPVDFTELIANHYHSRKAAMLPENAQEMLIHRKEEMLESHFVSWKLILLPCILLGLAVFLRKRLLYSFVIRFLTTKKNSTHAV